MKKFMKITLGILFVFGVMMSCKNESKTAMTLEEVQEPPKTVFAETVEVVNEKRVILSTNTLIAEQRELTVMVKEADVVHIQAGDEALIDFTDKPELTLAGTVSTIGTKPDPVTRDYEVEIILTIEEQALPQGMQAKAAITTQDTRPLISIPKEAIVSETPTTAKVYLLEDGQSLLKEVMVYKKDENRLLVSSGLTKGDQVVMVSEDYIQHDGTVLNK